jgi:hypothetical protein
MYNEDFKLWTSQLKAKFEQMIKYEPTISMFSDNLQTNQSREILNEIQSIVLSEKMLNPFINYFDNSKGYEYLI